MKAVIGLLKAQNDSVDFVPLFIEHYGYPLWNKSVFVEEGEQQLIFVPCGNNQVEIEVIWVFKVISDWVEYYPVQRERVQEGDEWSFDYFTQEALGRRPRSGMRFETSREESTTRPFVESTTCTQGFAGFEIDGELIEVSTGWHCWTSMKYVMAPPSLPEFYGTGIGGGSFSGGNDYYGGGGNVSNPPPVVSLHADLKTIFEGKCSLSDEQIKKLNDAFNEMLKECFYSYINNYLLQKNVKLRNILMAESGWIGQAAVTNLGDLKFADIKEITSENLKHEWIHLFQKQYHNTTFFGEKAGMAEFEVALVQDILKFIRYGDFGKIDSWSSKSNVPRLEGELYRSWIKQLTGNGKYYPSYIDNARFQELSKVFGNYNSSYHVSRGYKYGANIYNTASTQALFTEAKNHCNK